MDRATHYRELAEQLRHRSRLTPDPETREQLKVAARDLARMARKVEEEEKDKTAG